MRAAAQQVAGVLPLVQIKSLLFGNTLTSLPFLNYGGVMADTADAAEALVAAARRTGAGAQVQPRRAAARGAGSSRTCRARQHKVVDAAAAAPAAIWDGLDRKVRNQIRKAEKSGLVVERGGDDLVG